MPSTPLIRVATAADLPRLHPLIERAYRGETARAGWTHEADLLEGPRTSLDVLEAIVADPNHRLLLAEAEGVPLGCVAVRKLGSGRAYLGQLCVEPTLQARGLGRMLIAAAEACAAETFEADIMEMTVIEGRSELIAWYERCDYRATGERRDFPLPVDPPLFMMVLEKPLAGSHPHRHVAGHAHCQDLRPVDA